jgi:hypothetical protein
VKKRKKERQKGKKGKRKAQEGGWGRGASKRKVVVQCVMPCCMRSDADAML